MSVLTALHRRFFGLDIASRAAVLSFSSNALLMVMKVSVGLVFGSVAVLGDGVDSAEDVFASGIAFFTVRLALQPADESHPYGHGKAESLAAMSQAALIAAGAASSSLPPRGGSQPAPRRSTSRRRSSRWA